MRSFFDSIYSNAKDRVNNPFIGALFTSWMVLNWKPIFYIIFSTENIVEKLDYIEQRFSKDNLVIYWPLGIALFYVTIFPYLNWLFDKLSDKALKMRNDIYTSFVISKYDNDGRIELTKIKVDKLKQEALEGQNVTETIESLNSRIKSLEAENHSLTINHNETVNKLRAELANSKLNQDVIISNYEKIINSEKSIFNAKNRLADLEEQLKDVNDKIDIVVKGQRLEPNLEEYDINISELTAQREYLKNQIDEIRRTEIE